MANIDLEIAYGALLHDIGKFYQRANNTSIVSSRELECTPFHKNGYHTHIHSAYTAKFFHDYLQLDNYLEKATSAHHINDNTFLDTIIREADRIASQIDRNDEIYDYEENHIKTRYQYITSRLTSIMSNVNFGKEIYNSKFELDSIDNCSNPIKNYKEKDKAESISEYKNLFNKFINEVNKDNLLIGSPTPYKYHRLYSLLYKYTTLIPSSTYETNNQPVSLFDHLKLTTAIASALAKSDDHKFYMLEFDISGIQKFIYQITEGSSTKGNVAKSLRGRSAFISLVTNSITYTILNKFKLTQANIIFNTGGGAVLLLPYNDNTIPIVEDEFKLITKELYNRFNTVISVVYAIEELDREGLSNYKADKSLSLKTKLEQNKLKKYANIIDDDFIIEKIEDKEICELCGSNYASSNHICDNCSTIIDISNYYTNHDQFTILYTNEDLDDCILDLGFIKLYFFDNLPKSYINNKSFYYIDAVNHFEAGNVKLLANLVPKVKDRILNFEEITKTLDSSFGDSKLGVLKMDVDNLGAIFAFGLKQGDTLQCSLSKYLTLSRFMDLFFGYKLKQICLTLSQELQDKYENIFYINYAGGDDLVILGPVYGIVQLAANIRKEFKDFVQNPNITLSAGIHIQSPKKPIRFGVQMADIALDKSKANPSKDAITIMDRTIAFDEYPDLLKEVETYRTYLKDTKNPLSRTSLYNIMSNLSNKTLESYYSIVPIIQYIIFRQFGNKYQSIKKEIIKDLTTINNNYVLARKILKLKLVILFTREEN